MQENLSNQKQINKITAIRKNKIIYVPPVSQLQNKIKQRQWLQQRIAIFLTNLSRKTY